MTVAPDVSAAIHLLYTEDVPLEPHHIRSLQQDQQLMSLASRSFSAVLAIQQLAAAIIDNACSTQYLQSVWI